MLTPGQEEVRRIAKEILASDLSRSEMIEELRKQLACNEIVKNDTVTGAPLSSKKFSRSYFDWLFDKSTPIVASGKELPEVCMNNYDYDYAGPSYSPRYQGGDKWDTTFGCVLSLAEGLDIDPDGWDLILCKKTGYVRYGNGGNHRSVAHALAGYTNPTPSKVSIYHDLGFKQVENQSFLKLEKILAQRDFYVGSDELFVKIVSTMENITDSDIAILREFIKKSYQKTFLNHRAKSCLIEIREAIELADELIALKRWIFPFTFINQLLLTFRFRSNDQEKQLFKALASL